MLDASIVFRKSHCVVLRRSEYSEYTCVVWKWFCLVICSRRTVFGSVCGPYYRLLAGVSVIMSLECCLFDEGMYAGAGLWWSCMRCSTVQYCLVCGGWSRGEMKQQKKPSDDPSVNERVPVCV